jgi:hypothetical protein
MAGPADETQYHLSPNFGPIRAAVHSPSTRRGSGSIAYLGVLGLGFTLWIAYGIALGNAALIVPNSVALVIGAATIGIAARYRDPA